jgi:hypothetical protein
MATISNTPRPGYVWDSTDNVWYPIGVGAHQHTNAADTPAVMPYSTYAAAGKNKIINGDFAINQRNFTTDSVGGYNFDRFITAFSGGAGTVTAQTFTLGTAPVSGYEGKNFLRVAASSGNDYFRTVQPIEGVRTFAGQTATLSFWAKGTNPSTLGYLTVGLQQNFGTGGSPSATVTSAEQNLILTANWTRYSFTFNVPSIAGKTIGTSGGDKLDVMIGQISSTSTDSWTLDLWGVQFEAGSTATAFQTATGNPASELAACQRYYYEVGGDTAYDFFGMGFAWSSTYIECFVNHPVKMRVTPTLSSAGTFQTYGGGGTATITLGGAQYPSTLTSNIEFSGTGFNTGQGYMTRANNNTATRLKWSAEL